MNYYEELGVSQEATEQEIRKAHRRLVKLMHPDAQPDYKLKMLAETQMRRLNSIVSTLLDPDQRRSYDEQLHAAYTSSRYPSSSGLPSWKGIPWWLASASLAVVLVLVAVYVWADHMGSASASRVNHTAYTIPPATDTSTSATPAPPAGGTGDPDSSKPLGASYTPQGTPAQPSASVSDQPKGQDSQHGGISATVVDPAPPPVKQQEARVSTDPSPKPSQEQPPRPQAIPKPEQKVNSPAPLQTHPAVLEARTAQVTVPAPDLRKKAEKPIPSPPASNKNEPKMVLAHNDIPARPGVGQDQKQASVSQPKKFSMPPGLQVAQVHPNGGRSQLPAPPRIAAQPNRDLSASTLVYPGSALPSPTPPRTQIATGVATTGAGIGINPHDPLEGEWVYAPKEPERRRAGFYPPEYIDLKLFGSGDPGNLKGQYNAKYVVTDRPVSPDVSFELASAGKGSRKFVWQSSTGARGTLSIDTIDDRTIRVDWHTTSAVHGPALTSGTATLVRRQ